MFNLPDSIIPSLDNSPAITNLINLMESVVIPNLLINEIPEGFENEGEEYIEYSTPEHFKHCKALLVEINLVPDADGVLINEDSWFDQLDAYFFEIKNEYEYEEMYSYE